MLQSRNTVLQLGLYIFFYIYLSIIFFSFFFFGVHGTSFIDLEDSGCVCIFL